MSLLRPIDLSAAGMTLAGALASGAAFHGTTPSQVRRKPKNWRPHSDAPDLADLTDYPDLIPLFEQGGLINSLERRLNELTANDCAVFLSKNGIGMIDSDGMVYLGAGALRNFRNDSSTIAGIMAHEWGHALMGHCRVGDLNWTADQWFFWLRKSEAEADSQAGRLLCLLGDQPDGLVKLLLSGVEPDDGYVPDLTRYPRPDLRAQIVLESFRRQYNAQNRLRHLSLAGGVYAVPERYRLL